MIKLDNHCGTRKGYDLHLAKKEETCVSCRAVNNKRRKTWRDANPGHHLKYTANPKVTRRARLLQVYGLTIEDYDKLLTEQNGVCKICSKPETRYIKGVLVRLSGDHCHTTGKVRGLLCGNCNTALGAFDDNIEIMKIAIQYLEKDKEQ